MGRLTEYGAGDRLDIQSFPDCVDPEFLDAWASYITTQTAQDLYNSAPPPVGMVFAVQGFLSSLSQISTSFLIRAVPGFISDSVKTARVLLKEQRRNVLIWQNRNNFLANFQLAEVKTSINSNYNIVANCMSSTIDVYLVYVPRPIRGKVPKIGEVLHKKVPYWFSNKQPKALFKTDNLTKKFQQSTSPVMPDTYPTLPQLMSRPRLWYVWDEKLGIDCARIKGNAIALHIQSNRLRSFLGRHKRAEMERKLNKLVNDIYV